MRKNRNFNVVFVYSKKRVEAIDKKEEGNRIVYGNPVFFKQIENDVDRVYTDDSNIRTLYERAFVEVLPITETQAKQVTKEAAKEEAPVEDAEPEEAVAEDPKEVHAKVSLDTLKKQVAKVTDGEIKKQWRALGWHDQRKLAFDLADETVDVKSMKKIDVEKFLESKLG